MKNVRVEVCAVRPGNCACLEVYIDLREQLVVLRYGFEGRSPERGSKIDYALSSVSEPKSNNPIM